MNQELKTLKFFLGFPLNSGRGILNYFAAEWGDEAIYDFSQPDERRHFVYIPGTRQNKVLLVAHTDTAWDFHRENEILPVLKIHNDKIHSGLPGYGMGADDRAGVAILWLLRHSGHSLLLVNGEESGRIGSENIRTHHPELFEKIQKDHSFIIEFDRRNATDYKCYDKGTTRFREYLDKVLPGFTDPRDGGATDICTLCRNICGVNISTGFYNEHTSQEYIVVSTWLNTLNLMREWLAHPELPRFEITEFQYS
jgi:hypothetical protein